MFKVEMEKSIEYERENGKKCEILKVKMDLAFQRGFTFEFIPHEG